MAIGYLADRLRGGEPFVQLWPRNEPVLSLSERREMQELLQRHGFNVGEPNGQIGAKTRAAVRDYQASVGLVPDGFPTATILARLRSQ
jgi:peptidoglycan hydrolase-like protein with peptidoglycan-binding domain